MIDTKLLLRKGYFQALSGNLTYQGNNVPVYDDVAELGNTEDLYVLMSHNSSKDANTQNYFATEEDFMLQIVFTAQSRANKEAVDLVANQIFQIVCPTPQTNGLSAQPGVIFLNVYRSADLYDSFQLLDTKAVVRRLITFTQFVTESNYSPVPPPSGGSIMLKFMSADFSDSTTVNDSVLAGQDIAVFFNENSRYLNSGEFNNLPGGGFQILIPGFDKNDDNYTFYVSVLSN